MYDKYKISIRKNYDLLLAPFITAAILLACFIIGKIYPFGSNNVEYYDMAQGIIPNFYHIWMHCTLRIRRFALIGIRA